MGFRSNKELGGIAGATGISKILSISDGFGDTDSEVFALGDPAKRFRFYKLSFSMTYSAQGHATEIIEKLVIVKLQDDAEAEPALWQASLRLLVPPTEIRNAAIANVGFDVPGGIAFPVGADVKLAMRETETGLWGFNGFVEWIATVDVSVLVREVSQ